ncbi:DUF6233 domain-containing protein [Streptomyces sp. NPDC057654]|uniref:DUF6233 domain-containing protein n=1 Tax=Streptomyces sp. NPDC057654 TaxID=3346196 RepID=UPI003683E1D7
MKWWRLVPARRGRQGGTVHRGDCAVAGGRLLSLAEARRVLDEPHVKACTTCHPERRLRA